MLACCGGGSLLSLTVRDSPRHNNEMHPTAAWVQHPAHRARLATGNSGIIQHADCLRSMCSTGHTEFQCK